jgi:hypothetical protein
MSWLNLTKIRKANIPEELRLQFDRMGVEVVSQIMARYLEIEGNRYGFPFVAIVEAPLIEERKDREHATEWLLEQRSISERRREISERIELMILVLVGMEAIPVAFHFVLWLFGCVAEP